MKVRELAPTYVASCRPETNLAAAAALFWEHDCGFLPVVNETYKVVGVLTDRDICMALATRNKLASELQVQDVMISPVHTIAPGDTATQAMRVMRDHHVRRLPVTTADGVLEGVISLNDLALAAHERKDEFPSPPTYEEVTLTLKSLCAHAHSKKPKAGEQLVST